MKQRFRFAIAVRTVGALLDLLLRSTRYHVEGEEHYQQYVRAGKPVIFALWHGRLLPLSFQHRGQGVATLVSRSTDGEYIARVLQRWGFVPARGSSSRGGTAGLRELVRHARAGRSLAITPDGPRGPRQQLKPGILVAAQLTGAPLIPVAAGATRAWWFGGWDRFLVPQPFARVHVVYGAPIVVPRDAQGAALDRMRLAVEETLNTLLQQADARAGHG